MRCIVTGGAGFIGSHLVDKLLELGHKVIVIDNFSTGRESNLFGAVKHDGLLDIKCVDVTDTRIRLLFKDVDWVFHLAGLADIVPSMNNPWAYYNSNVTGTLSVLEACREYGIKKLVYAASSSCYGIPRRYPTPETAKIQPMYPYALTKYMGEQLVLHWGRVYKLPTISLRLFNVFGPRMWSSTYGGIFKVFLAQKYHNKPFTRVGDGTQERDFIFISDVADAFVKAVEFEGREKVFNIGSGFPYSINELIYELSGLEAKIIQIPKRPREPSKTHADITRARNSLLWEPKVSFYEGIQIMLKHIEDYKDAPIWTKEKIDKETKAWFRNLK